MNKKLFVFYKTQLVGTLSEEDYILSFSYSQSWLENPDSFPLSIAIPLINTQFSHKATLSFFENLLPEGDVKKAIERDNKISGTFNLLSEFGLDCAGAFIVTPKENFEYEEREEDLKEVNLDLVYSAIDVRGSVAQTLIRDMHTKISLAGAQDKFAGIFKDGKIYVPLNGQPTTHIIKAPVTHSGIKESVYNEYYCLKLAEAIGLPVPKVQILTGKHPLLIIERYDRVTDGQKYHRIHQEDFCQAQEFSSANKYEKYAGPTIKSNYEFIMNHVVEKDRIKSANLFLKWIAFNLLLRNCDSHSKNISLLHKDKKCHLAPFYDLLCTYVYDQLDKEFAFRIGGKSYLSQIGKKQFEELDKDLGSKEGRFQKIVQETYNEVFKKHDLVKKEMAEIYGNFMIVDKIIEEIKNQAKSISNQQGLIIEKKNSPKAVKNKKARPIQKLS